MRKFFNKSNDQLSEVSVAFSTYEHVFVKYKGDKMNHIDNISGGYGDMSDIEKAHLDLLKAKLDMEIANEAKLSQEKLQNAAWILSLALVVAALFELFQ